MVIRRTRWSGWSEDSAPEGNDLVRRDAFGDGGGGEGPFFQYVVDAVVANAANVTALGLDDAIEEGELGIAAIHDVEAIGFDGAFQDGPLIAVAAAVGSDIDASRHVAIDFEMSMQSPLDQAARVGRLQRRFGEVRQDGEQRAIDEGDGMANVLEAWIDAERLQLLAQFADDFLEPFGIEDGDRFGQRTERGSRAAQLLLHVLKFAGLLQAANRLDDGVEKEEQNQHAILIVMQRPIAGAIPLAADVMETVEQGRELIEVLQAADVLLLDLGRRRRWLAIHGDIMPRCRGGRNTVLMYLFNAQIACRTRLVRVPFTAWMPTLQRAVTMRWSVGFVVC